MRISPESAETRVALKRWGSATKALLFFIEEKKKKNSCEIRFLTPIKYTQRAN